MKRLLFSTFLFMLLFVFINSYNAKSGNECNLLKEYKDLSTRNILDKLSYNQMKNIERICTGKICSFNLDANYNKLLSDHEEKVALDIKNEEEKINIELKGIKIDTIYFKDCIY